MSKTNKIDNTSDDDDDLKLSESTFKALQEFYEEQKKSSEAEADISEDWVSMYN